MKILRIILLPLTLIYTVVITLRNLFFEIGIFKTRKVDTKIISVGNITAGGSGKTPIVEYLVNHLLSNNLKVAVVSRGYKRKSKGLIVVSDGNKINSDPSICGDEPVQIASKFPQAIVIVAEKKYVAAKIAKEEFNVDVVILDDGFQHRKLFRNLDLVIIDTQKKGLDKLLLPSGFKREPLCSLKRADIILFNGKLENKIIQKFPNKLYLTFKYEVTKIVPLDGNNKLNLDVLKNKNCYAFCGIGSPASFYSTLNDIELKIVSFKTYSDHHFYSDKDLKKILKEFEDSKCDFIITTEKDFLKLKQYHNKILDIPFYYIQIEVKFNENEKYFLNLIDKTIKEQ